MSGAPEDSNFKLVTFGKFQRRLRYNSPDCPVYTGLSGATAGQRLFRRQRLPATHLMRAQKRAVVRHAGAGAPDTLQYMSGAPPDIKAGPEVRTPTVDPTAIW